MKNQTKKIILLLSIISIIQLGFAQNSSSKVGIKKIIETESYTHTTSDGKKHVNISEINEVEYNLEGRITSKNRKTFYKNKPYKTLITKYLYNENGEISYESNFVIEDSIKYNTKYNYLNNKLIDKSFQFIENEKESRFLETFLYNKNEKLISSTYKYHEKYVDSDFFIRDLTIKSIYDKEERTIEMDWNESDSTYKYNRYVYKWNNKGLLLKEKEYNIANDLIKTTSFKYKFDNRNNWTVKMLYVKKVLVETAYREIEYYN